MIKIRKRTTPAAPPLSCPRCGTEIPAASSQRSGYRPLIIGLAAVLVLLILGILDSQYMRARLGLSSESPREPEAVLTTGNMIPNPSVEQVSVEDSTRPVAWRTSKWGSNSPVFDYLESAGRTGTRALRVTMSNHADGDAKWVHQPVAVIGGRDYQYSDSYQASVDTQVVVELYHADGKKTYQALPNAPASSTWQQYVTSFTVPPTVNQAVVFHLISGNGYLVVDDFALRPHEAEGFARGLITLTFDDGWETNVETVIPRLEENDLKSVQFFATTFLDGVDDTAVRDVWNAGHEVGSHSVNHEDLRKLDDEQLAYELRHSKEFLESITGSPINVFATPFGAYDSRVLDAVRDNGYSVHRSVDSGFNARGDLDPLNVRVRNVLVDTPVSEVQSWVDKARRERLWLVLVYHRVGTENLGRYDTRIEDFEKHLEIFTSADLPVVTLSEALSELAPQLEADRLRAEGAGEPQPAAESAP